MAVNNEFKNLLSKDDIKFTIILGSGFHHEAIGGDSILSSWDILLNALSNDVILTKQYHLDFERIIQSQKTQFDDSYVSEKELIKCVQKLLKKRQNEILKDSKFCYPLGIFNPKKISDVISLNFDEIPEQLLNKKNGVVIGGFINNSNLTRQKDSSKKLNNNSYSYLSTRYKLVVFSDNGSIRFWHPHGVIGNNKSIVLGAHRYAQMVNTSIRVRNHHLKEKRKNSKEMTWYKSLVENPVLILGAGMSPTEWDMWFALTSRNRANGDKQPIFQMRECECKNDAQHQWFQPLFTGMDFNQQWKELEKLFKK